MTRDSDPAENSVSFGSSIPLDIVDFIYLSPDIGAGFNDKG